VRAGIVAAFVLILASGLARHPLWVLYGAGIVAGLLPLSPQALSTLPGEALVHQWLTFAGIVAVVAYLTSRLREQEAALSEITDRKERFVALAHHELRTPVTVLTSALDTLMEDLDGVLSPEQRHFLEAAQLNTDRLRHQVEMLTRYAELKDVAAADVEVAPLGETIDRVAAELAPYFAGRGVGLVQEVDPKAAWVSFPGPHVETILRQLLRNSATFNAPEGSVRLSVTCRRSSVVIEVEDDGWGIEPESRAAIFESFYQPGDLLTRQREGLGFGLALVNLAVERLDGAVDVTSASGQGSCFIVRLPMRPWITTGDTSASSEPPADHRVGARTA
jgi:signal transduction histidine kinase